MAILTDSTLDRNKVMSSASWQSFISVCPTFKPETLLFFLKTIAFISTTSKNNKALIGQPCLIPLDNLKNEDVYPLLATQLSESLYKIVIHFLKL